MSNSDKDGGGRLRGHGRLCGRIRYFKVSLIIQCIDLLLFTTDQFSLFNVNIVSTDFHLLQEHVQYSTTTTTSSTTTTTALTVAATAIATTTAATTTTTTNYYYYSQ